MPSLRTFSVLVLFATASAARAALLPTEIYYNGPAAGIDRDEFVELVNTSRSPLGLEGFSFKAGLGLTFPDLILAPRRTLIVAPNPQGFLERFAGFAGVVLDASGSLSNAGETLTLLDAASVPVFSLTYDDRGAWPTSADGAGDSLQLLAGAVDPSNPASWGAGTPDPGRWAGSAPPDNGGHDDASAVPAPSTLWLLAAGFLLVRVYCRGGGENTLLRPTLLQDADSSCTGFWRK